MRRNLIMVMVWCMIIVGISIYLEWKQLGDLKIVYKQDASPLFFLYTESEFYRMYSIQEIDSAFKLRKIGHFCFYGAISSVFFYYNLRENPLTRITYASISPVLIGLVDEIHQFFLSGRSGLMLDVVVDTAGTISAVTIASVCWLLYSRVVIAIEKIQSNV